MAARFVALSIRSLKIFPATTPGKTLATRTSLSSRHSFSTTDYLRTPVAQQISRTAENPVAATMARSASPSGQTEEDYKNAAYLGEADSDDGFEAWRDAHGSPPPVVDATNAAYLGEADSDDGFEVNKDIHGQNLEAIDATQAAYLGEADSNDGFEADIEIFPEKHEHRFEDVSSSGQHGQPGEGDQ